MIRKICLGDGDRWVFGRKKTGRRSAGTGDFLRTILTGERGGGEEKAARHSQDTPVDVRGGLKKKALQKRW